MPAKKKQPIPPASSPSSFLDAETKQALLQLPDDLAGLFHMYFEPREISLLHMWIPQWRNQLSFRPYIEEGMRRHIQACFEHEFCTLFHDQPLLPWTMEEIWNLMHRTGTWISQNRVHTWLRLLFADVVDLSKLRCEIIIMRCDNRDDSLNAWIDWVERHYEIQSRKKRFSGASNPMLHFTMKTPTSRKKHIWLLFDRTDYPAVFQTPATLKEMKERISAVFDPFAGHVMGKPSLDQPPALILHPRYDLLEQNAIAYADDRLLGDSTLVKQWLDHRSYTKIVIRGADELYAKYKQQPNVVVGRMLSPTEWKLPCVYELLLNVPDKSQETPWSDCGTLPEIHQEEMMRDPSRFGKRMSTRQVGYMRDREWPTFIMPKASSPPVVSCGAKGHTFVSFTTPLSESILPIILPVALDVRTGKWLMEEELLAHLDTPDSSLPLPMPWWHTPLIKEKARLRLLSEHTVICYETFCQHDPSYKHVEICLSCLYHRVEQNPSCECLLTLLRRPHLHWNGMTIVLE